MDIRKLVSSVSTETNEIMGRVEQHLVLTSSVKVNQAKRERLLQSLKYLGFNERRNQVSQAYEKTAKWIFAGDRVDETDLPDLEWDSFSNWLRSTEKFYWISGKAASGKSTLVKFIIGHPNTKTFLDIWNTGTLLISHFFWRPGTALQQNIKGLLCSLLYQLLQHSDTALRFALSSARDSNTKDTDTDWSTPELEDLCLQVSSAYDQPLCIFLDGLDEVDPRDGVIPLLDLIDKISQGKNIKMCLSSRPEPLLQNRLSINPRLRLQDLNRGDMELYARYNVKIPGGYSVKLPKDTITLLVDRAEGVFLWLILAIKSVNEGMEYGDSAATYQERINQLPGDLVNLYKDMWNRACENAPPTYRQTAALYFKLLLTHSNRDSLFEQLFGYFTILSLMLASTLTADQILEAGHGIPRSLSKDIMLQKCREVERNANVYCFGLIELLSTSDPTWSQALGMYGHEFDDLIPFADGSRVLRFIHRTAHDFLVDTEDGKEILNFNNSSKFSLETRIIKAYLAGSQLFVLAPSHTFGHKGASFAGSLLPVIEDLRLAYKGSDDWSAREWRQLLHYCEMLSHAGKLFSGSHGRARLCQGEDFLKISANTCGDERILSAIKKGELSKSTKSEILLNACEVFVDGYDASGSRDPTVEESIRTLVRDGADPNHKGVVFSPVLWHWPFAQLETPFTKYLEVTLMRVKYECLNLEELYSVLETLHIFISHGANLDELVIFPFDLMKSDPKGCTESVWMLKPRRLVQLHWHRSFHNMTDDSRGLFASFPAQGVLDTLLYTIRHTYAPLAEETRFREIISSLENEYLDWNGQEKSRVFGKMERSTNSPKWYETIGKHQEWIANGLLAQWRKCQGPEPEELLLTNPDTEGIELEGSVENMESLLSLCEQAPWTFIAEGPDEINARLEKLGIFTRVNKLYEVHSTEDWVLKRRAAMRLESKNCLSTES